MTTATPPPDERPRPTNLAELTALIDDLLASVPDDEDGYSTAADVLWQAPLAVFNYVADQLAVTGFQGSWAALRFYGEAMSIEGPFMMVNAHDALYPQYDLPGRVQSWLTELAPWFAEQATELLATRTTFAAPTVVDHWRRLAAAAPPPPAPPTAETPPPPPVVGRVAGHGLIAEGAPHVVNDRKQTVRANGGAGGVGGLGRGLCSCGALSEMLDSGGQRKAWHRTHKAEVTRRG